MSLAVSQRNRGGCLSCRGSAEPTNCWENRGESGFPACTQKETSQSPTLMNAQFPSSCFLVSRPRLSPHTAAQAQKSLQKETRQSSAAAKVDCPLTSDSGRPRVPEFRNFLKFSHSAPKSENSNPQIRCAFLHSIRPKWSYALP